MGRKGEQTRERILDTAADLVVQRGFGATSMQELQERAGVNRGTLYFHFPGKEDLGLAVLERARRGFLAFLREALTGDTPGERLERFFQAALRAHRATGFVGGCLWGNTALEMADAGGDARYVRIVRAVFAEWIEMTRAVIAEAQESGQVRGDLKAADLALQVVCTIEGGIMLSRLRKSEVPLRTCLEALRQTLGLRGAIPRDLAGDRSDGILKEGA